MMVADGYDAEEGRQLGWAEVVVGGRKRGVGEETSESLGRLQGAVDASLVCDAEAQIATGPGP